MLDETVKKKKKKNIESNFPIAQSSQRRHSKTPEIHRSIFDILLTMYHYEFQPT
jgi:hypothetical protein